MKAIKIAILLIIASYMFNADAGTCTTISRTNYTTEQVLTSDGLNTDFNTVYNAANAFDGGCVTDGTLEKGALNTTDFAALYQGISEGCKLEYVTAATMTIDKCIMSINNGFVRTTSTTAVGWGDLDTGSEATSTIYYVYAGSASSGTTIDPIISTTEPGDDGFNGSNRVVGKFTNDASGDITESSIVQWKKNGFDVLAQSWSTTSAYVVWGTATVSNQSEAFISSISGSYPTWTVNFVSGFWSSAPSCIMHDHSNSHTYIPAGAVPTTSGFDTTSTVANPASTIICHGLKN